MMNVIVVFHFELFFALLPPRPPLTAQKIKTLKKFTTNPEIWCMTDVIIFNFGLFFALLPLNSPKKKIKKKMKITSGDIIILHMYTKSHDHMLYCS